MLTEEKKRQRKGIVELTDSTKQATAESEKKPGFFDLLSEDDSPQIGIAAKEPLPDYAQGVKAEFKRIEWPSRSQVGQEFVTVIFIVSLLAMFIFLVDLGLDKVVDLISGGRV